MTDEDVMMDRDTSKKAGNISGGTLDDVRGEAGTAVRRKPGKFRPPARRGPRTIAAMANRVVDFASNAPQSIVTYTKKNPAQALALAAASGALLYAAIRALSPSRR